MVAVVPSVIANELQHELETHYKLFRRSRYIAQAVVADILMAVKESALAKILIETIAILIKVNQIGGAAYRNRFRSGSFGSSMQNAVFSKLGASEMSTQIKFTRGDDLDKTRRKILIYNLFWFSSFWLPSTSSRLGVEAS